MANYIKNKVMFFQIDPTQLAKEIAQQINPPQTQEETIVFGLFALSGWAVAMGVLWWNWHKEKQRVAIETKRSDEMIKDKEADRALFERSIASMTEAATAVTMLSGFIKDLTTRVDGIGRDIIEMKANQNKKE